jgi:hypothetical protein
MGIVGHYKTKRPNLGFSGLSVSSVFLQRQARDESCEVMTMQSNVLSFVLYCYLRRQVYVVVNKVIRGNPHEIAIGEQRYQRRFAYVSFVLRNAAVFEADIK